MHHCSLWWWLSADKYLQVSFGDGFLLHSELEVLHFPGSKLCDMFLREWKYKKYYISLQPVFLPKHSLIYFTVKLQTFQGQVS